MSDQTPPNPYASPGGDPAAPKDPYSPSSYEPTYSETPITPTGAPSASSPYAPPGGQPYGGASQQYPGQQPAQTYPGQTYPGQQYPSGAQPGQAYPGQQPTGQQYPGQAYPGQAYPGQAYPPEVHPGQQLPAGYAYQPYPASKPVSGLAIASLVCSVLWVFWLGSLAGVILGLAALGETKERKSGRGMAIAGIVLGALALLGLVAIIVAFASSYDGSSFDSGTAV